MSQEKKKPKMRSFRLMLVQDMPSRTQAGAGVQLRVVQWVFDDKPFEPKMRDYGYLPTPEGKSFNVKLEKRAYYTKDGVLLSGKAEGWSLGDLIFLHPKWKEIIALMKTPPQPPTLPRPAAKVEDIEEVPF